MVKNGDIFKKKLESTVNELKESKNCNKIQQITIGNQEAIIQEHETELMKLKNYINHLEQIIDTTTESVKDALGVSAFILLNVYM